MTWRYQATHRTITTPGGETEDVFEVREVYEGLNEDGSLSWTENAVTPASETKDGLIDVVQTMIKVAGSISWTESAVAPDSDTKAGLIEVLQMMLKDVQHFDVLEVDE